MRQLRHALGELRLRVLKILSDLIPWLESRGIYSRGRFGMWKYEVANTDHSLMQGVEWVNRMISGEAETTIGLNYRVTENGRAATEHHRPSVAGSGEKRLFPVGQGPAGGGVAIEAKPAVSGVPALAEHVTSVVHQRSPIAEEEIGITPSEHT